MMKRFFVILPVLISVSLYAQKKKTENFNTLFIEGVKEYILHNHRSSLEKLTQALSLKDDEPAVYFYIALDNFYLGDSIGARENLEKAMRLNPANAIYRKVNDTLYAYQLRVHYEKPVAVVNKVADKDSFLRSSGDLPVRQVYDRGKKLMEKYPFDPRLIYRTARAAFDLKKYDESKEMLLNGLDFAQTDRELLRKYYRLLLRIAKITGAKAEAGKYEKKLKTLMP